jgi:hypothetical protein
MGGCVNSENEEDSSSHIEKLNKADAKEAEMEAEIMVRLSATILLGSYFLGHVKPNFWEKCDRDNELFYYAQRRILDLLSFRMITQNTVLALVRS